MRVWLICMRWGLIAAIAVLLGASAAEAAQTVRLPDALTVPDNLDCRQTFASYGPTGIPSWTVGDRDHRRGSGTR